ncbi:MAG: glycogen synthase [Candidatus Marinimicrobia bacterium]|nr:glycogen synthase [Candidatus Neomarinimicrobiota bacterium]
MEIAIVASEIVGFSKVGGMGDVVGALPPFFIEKGIITHVFSPAYKSVLKSDKVKKTDINFLVEMGKEIFKCSVFKFEYDQRSAIYFIDNEQYFRDRNVYVDEEGLLYEDNSQRFILFQKAVLDLMVVLDMRPNILHCHDNQAALIPLFLKTKYQEIDNFKHTKSILTIHNIGYHGSFDMSLKHLLGIDENYFHPMGRLEWWGEINPLKAGIIYSDKITTVSEHHAREISEDEILSAGMRRIFQSRNDTVIGIINGLNFDEWDPAIDEDIACNYTIHSIDNKMKNRDTLLEECGIKIKFIDKPLLGIVTRLVEQKGIALLLQIFPKLMKEGYPLVLLGNGDPEYRDALEKLQEKHKGQFYFDDAFNKALGHRIIAGSDLFLMPSRYEPCGITQMQAMKYGTIPLAHKTGGLVDTIKQDETGFIFNEYKAESFLDMIHYAETVYRNKEQWKKMIVNAMKQDFSWHQSVEKYIQLYEEMCRSIN